MADYNLEIKQIVDYPRCRIYRQFVRNLMDDQILRVGSGVSLFSYVLLCSYANFRTSYKRIDEFSYTVYPGEWVCQTSELKSWLRTRFQHQALSILQSLQDRNLIKYSVLNRGRVVKFSIVGWRKHNLFKSTSI